MILQLWSVVFERATMVKGMGGNLGGNGEGVGIKEFLANCSVTQVTSKAWPKLLAGGEKKNTLRGWNCNQLMRLLWKKQSMKTRGSQSGQ